MHSIITDGIAVASIIMTLAIIVTLVSWILGKIKLFSRISVQLLSAIVSVALCVAGYFAYCVYAGIPVIWYPALDTQTTTDITDLMTGALPLMATEPGGTITMHHALADDGLMLDVPNTVKYIRDLKEVASSGTD